MTNSNSFFSTLLTNVNNFFKKNPVLRFFLYLALIIAALVSASMLSSCSSVRTMIKSDGSTTVSTGVSQSVDSMSISLFLNQK